MRRARFEKHRAPQICGNDFDARRKLRAIQQQLDQAAQDFVIRSRADVLFQSRFEFGARAASMLAEEFNQSGGGV
jgi:hypothetical protein